MGQTKYPRKFERINASGNTITERLKVPNGWVLRTRHIVETGNLSSMVFIPSQSTHWKLEEGE